MTQYIKYKGYTGTIETRDDGSLFGKIDFIRDLITYEADTLSALTQKFQQSVDGYLQDCIKCNKVPDHPSRGSFNIRLTQGLQKAMIQAILDSSGDTLKAKSINEFICEAIEEKLDRINSPD